MAFDPGQTGGDVWGFIKEHPAGIAIAVGGLVVLFILLSRGGSSAPQSVAVPVDPTADAAAVQGQQIAVNGQTAIATIAAGVTNNQTAAAETVALATIQGQNDATAAAATAGIANSYYNAATAISDNNTSAAIASINARSAEQISSNANTASEFADLAKTVASFGGNTQSILDSLNSTGAAIQKDVVSSVSGGSGAITFQPTNVTLGGTTVSPLDLSGLSLPGDTGYYAGVIQIKQHQADVASAAAQNTVNANAATAIAASNAAGQVGVANANAAAAASVAGSGTAIFSGLAGAAKNGLSIMTGWLSQLTGAFGVATKASAPVTPTVDLPGLQSANNSLLSGFNPTFFALH